MTPNELARQTRPSAPPEWGADPNRLRLASAAHSSRFLGGFFAILGCLPLLAAHLGQWSLTWAQTLAFIDTLVLVGPGVWYFIACTFIRRYQRNTILLTRRIAVAQAALIVLLLAVLILAGRMLPFIAIPTILTVFFLPALGAYVFELSRAAHAVNALAPTASAFRPVLVAPIAAAPEPLPPSPPPPAA